MRLALKVVGRHLVHTMSTDQNKLCSSSTHCSMEIETQDSPHFKYERRRWSDQVFCAQPPLHHPPPSFPSSPGSEDVPPSHKAAFILSTTTTSSTTTTIYDTKQHSWVSMRSALWWSLHRYWKSPNAKTFTDRPTALMIWSWRHCRGKSLIESRATVITGNRSYGWR